MEHSLDALYDATNASGKSAFNCVERKLAPLSKELAGLIIPHDLFGSHLDSQLRTTDEELKRQNSKFAGETLAGIWGDVSIDGFPTVAEYVDPDTSEVDPETLECRDHNWFDMHVSYVTFLARLTMVLLLNLSERLEFFSPQFCCH